MGTKNTMKKFAMVGCAAGAMMLASGAGAGWGGSNTIQVSGTGIDFFTTATIHSQTPTPTGFIQESTNFVELTGDLNGKILYSPTGEFDFAAGTLTNTGANMFHGTIAGSEPQHLWNRESQGFVEVNLFTGQTYGEFTLRRSRDGGKGEFRKCDLILVGNGETTPEGDPVVDYSGTCTCYGPCN